MARRPIVGVAAAVVGGEPSTAALNMQLGRCGMSLLRFVACVLEQLST